MIATVARVSRRIPGGLFRLAAAEIMAARTEDLRLLPRMPRAFSVRPAGNGDDGLVASFYGDPAKTNRLREQGDACVLALADGQVHAGEWVRWGPASYGEDERRLGVVFRIPSRCCWLHNGRNRNDDVIGPWGLVMGRLREVLQPKVETAFLQVDAEDAYSIACHESLGFRRRGRLIAVGILRVRLVGCRPPGGRWFRLTHRDLDLGRMAG